MRTAQAEAEGASEGGEGEELEDREPLDGWVVRATLGWGPLHPSVLDPEFLVEESDFASKAVVFGLEPHLSIEVILRLATRYREDHVGHRDGVDDGRPDPTRPALGQRDAIVFRFAEREEPPRGLW